VTEAVVNFWFSIFHDTNRDEFYAALKASVLANKTNFASSVGLVNEQLKLVRETRKSRRTSYEPSEEEMENYHRNQVARGMIRVSWHFKDGRTVYRYEPRTSYPQVPKLYTRAAYWEKGSRPSEKAMELLRPALEAEWQSADDWSDQPF
jgi:hypothetical protein